jgi:hypothetical protein
MVINVQIMKAIISLRTLAIGVLFTLSQGFVSPEIPLQQEVVSKSDTIKVQRPDNQTIKVDKDIHFTLPEEKALDKDVDNDSICNRTHVFNECTSTMKTYLLIISPASLWVQEECLHIFEIL